VYILAGVGLRTTLEAICKEQGITGRDAMKKIDQLASRGLITKKDAERLHGIRFLGNDAAHDMRPPTLGQLRVALKIVDHLLNSLYVFENEIRGQLDHVISNIEDLVSLLTGKLIHFEIGDQKSLRSLLGRDARRLLGESHALLESQLKERITTGAYSHLELSTVAEVGEEKEKVQLYRVVSKGPARAKPFAALKALDPEETL
jgi:hypothetical protein